MTMEQAAKQLNDLKDDRMAFANVDDPDDPFVRDIIAIDTVLSYVRTVKHGRWGSWSGLCTCTNCHTCYAVDLSNFSYCPSCGADMRKDGKQHD